ncbi:MAG: threonine dehydratase [Scytonematopsis contorta HA4267-MV1]|jgi:hypothetical protein|nr:threonine dehydratase [Scytonematopsis contorta HA4267-MV1]
MFRVIQIVRNSLIRILALTSLFFGFLGNKFNAVSKLFGFKSSEYFLDSQEANTLKKIQAKSDVEVEVAKPVVNSTSNSRPRRNDPNMDYFRNMAKQVKNSN